MAYENLIDRFKQIVDDASEIGGGRALQLTVTGEDVNDPKATRNITLSDLWRDTKNSVEQAQKQEYSQFLIPPLLDSALTKLTYLYPVTMHQIMADWPRIEEKKYAVIDLRIDIRETHAFSEWETIADGIRAFTSKAGIPLREERLNDVADLSPILLDALAVPSWGRRKFQRGADSTAPVKILWNMPRFHTKAEFYDCFSHIKEENCIALTFIEERIGDKASAFREWSTGYKEELVRNHCGRGGGSLDDCHFGYFMIGIKRGENIWALQEGGLSWSESPYRSHSWFSYGKRASYMPYQIVIHKEDVRPSTALAIRGNDTWDIRPMLDEEQAIWFPVALSAIENVFFKGPLPEDNGLTILGQAMMLTAGNTSAEEKGLALSIAKTYDLGDIMNVPDYIDGRDPMGEKLLKILNVTIDDLANVPLNDERTFTIGEAELEKYLWNRGRTAIANIAERRLNKDFLSSEVFGSQNNIALKDAFSKAVEKNIGNIIEMVKDHNPRILAITAIKMDGRERDDGYTEYTTVDDGRICRIHGVPQFFYPAALYNRRPQVSILIHPKTPADLALVMGCKEKDMDWRFRFWHHKRVENDKAKEVDPLARIKNPYEDLALSIAISMGKKDCKNMIGELPQSPAENFPRNHYSKWGGYEGIRKEAGDSPCGPTLR